MYKGHMGWELSFQGSPGLANATSNLLNHDVNLVSVLHAELFRSLALVEAFPIEEEADVAGAELCEAVGTFWRWQ
jgi:hypothetical protein